MEYLKRIPIKSGRIRSAAYHIDATCIALGTDDGYLVLVQIEEPRAKIIKISGFDDAIWNVTPDNARAVIYAASMGGTLGRVDISKMIATHFEQQSDFFPRFLSATENTPFIIIVSTDGQIQLRLKENLALAQEPIHIDCEVRTCLWNEEQRVLVLGGDRGEIFLITSLDENPKIVELERGRRMVSGLLHNKKNPETFFALFESGDLRKIRYDGSEYDHFPEMLPRPSYGLVGLCDDRILISAGKGEPYVLHQDRSVSQLPFHPVNIDIGLHSAINGRQVLSLDFDGEIQYWDSITGDTTLTIPLSSATAKHLFATQDPTLFLIGYDDQSVGLLRVGDIPLGHTTVKRPLVDTMVPSVDSKRALVTFKDGTARTIDLDDLAVSESTVPDGYSIVELTESRSYLCPQDMIVETIVTTDGEYVPETKQSVVISLNGGERKAFRYSIGGTYAISPDLRFIAVSAGIEGESMSVHSLTDQPFEQTFESDWLCYSGIHFSAQSRYIAAAQSDKIDIFERETGLHKLRYAGKVFHDCTVEGFMNDHCVLVRHEHGDLLVLRVSHSDFAYAGYLHSDAEHFTFMANKECYLEYTADGKWRTHSIVIDETQSLHASPFRKVSVELNSAVDQPDIRSLYKAVFGMRTAYFQGGKIGNTPAYFDHSTFELRGKQLDGDGCQSFHIEPILNMAEVLGIARMNNDMSAGQRIVSVDERHRMIVAHEFYHVLQALTLSTVFAHVHAMQVLQDIRLNAAIFLKRSGQTLEKGETLIEWLCKINSAMRTSLSNGHENDHIRARLEQYLGFSGKQDAEPFLSLIEGSAVIFEHLATGREIQLHHLEREFGSGIYTSAIRKYFDAGGRSALCFLLSAETSLHYGRIEYQGGSHAFGFAPPGDIFEFLSKNAEHFESQFMQVEEVDLNDLDKTIDRCSEWLDRIRDAVVGHFSLLNVRPPVSYDENHLLASALNSFTQKFPTYATGLGALYLLANKEQRKAFVDFVNTDIAAGETANKYLGQLPFAQLRTLNRSFLEHDSLLLTRGQMHFCCKVHEYVQREKIRDCALADSTYGTIMTFFGRTMEKLHDE